MTEAKEDNNTQLIGSTRFLQARLSDNQKYIIDSEGNRVEYDDPRVVIVDPSPKNPYGKRMVEHLYKRKNRKIRIADETTPEILQYSKKLCSGSECLPSVAIVGAVLKDLYEYRSNDEIILVRNPGEQEGPCQNAAWPQNWKVFAERLGMRNVIFAVFPKPRNKYLGFNLRDFLFENLLYAVSEYIIEVRNALQCLATDKISTLEKFEEITQRFIIKIKDETTLKKALIEWSEEVRNIPLQKSLKKIPKILIIGGLNLLFCHYPVEKYFLDKGIIPKVVDGSESIEWYSSEYAVRYGFKRGIMDLIEQIQFRKILLSTFNNNLKEVFRALVSSLAVKYVKWKKDSYRKIMSKSGLLFDESPSYKYISENSFDYISHIGFTEVSTITMRFLHAQKTGIYDGIINLGCFNCSPAMNSQAIIRPLANKSSIPYVAIDVEGPSITANQRRVLETIAVQIKRKKKEKNEGKNKNS